MKFREKRFRLARGVYIHIGVSALIGICIGLSPVGLTLSLWPAYFQIEWNERYHDWKLRRAMRP